MEVPAGDGTGKELRVYVGEGVRVGCPMLSSYIALRQLADSHASSDLAVRHASSAGQARIDPVMKLSGRLGCRLCGVVNSMVQIHTETVIASIGGGASITSSA